ncbi:hypothetical protein EON65_31015 [archaeon]|nr:MAG: hypothetical protein EON65_31015 [archaeon]
MRNTSVVTADGNRYNESVDVDIERMYAGSPTLQEWPTVYNFDQMYQVEAEVSHFTYVNRMRNVAYSLEICIYFIVVYCLCQLPSQGFSLLAEGLPELRK